LYPADATYLHIDIDGAEIGRNYEAVRLAGDARETLTALTETLEKRDLSRRELARAEVERLIREGKARFEKESASVRTGDGVPIRPERLMAELERVLTKDAIVVADASYSSIWVVNYLTARQAGQRFLTPRGLAGLGWGFPMAMGAKLARPDAPVYCVVGDGGFGHVWSELETARRMDIKVTLIVLNNGILGYQKHAENVKFGAHTSAVDFYPVDHAAIARAAGCDGIRVESPSDIEAALAAAASSRVTTLIDLICDENAYPPITSFTPA
jgi:acetolactate synthase-1/2/3 large subunit